MLKNFLTLAGGEIIARGLQALAMVLLTRTVGMGAISQFGLASSIAAYGLLLVMQGFDTIAVRASAQKGIDPRRATEEVMGLRVVLAILLAIATGLWAWNRPADPAGHLLLILSGIYFSNALTPRWFFLAELRSTPLAVAGAISQLCFLAGVLAVRTAGEISYAAWAQVAGEAAAAAYLWMAAKRPRLRLNTAFSRWLLAESWPVTLSLMMGTALYNFDLIALGALGRRVEIGPYLSSYRCIAVFSPLLGALQNSTFPRFAASWPDFEAIRRKVDLLAVVTSSLLVLASLALFLFASPILRLLYGPDIGQSATLLRILVWVLPIQGFRAVLRQALLAFRGQRTDARVVMVGLLTNICLDLTLIPRMGAAGCAVSTLAAESVFLAGTWVGWKGRRNTLLHVQ